MFSLDISGKPVVVACKPLSADLLFSFCIGWTVLVGHVSVEEDIFEAPPQDHFAEDTAAGEAERVPLREPPVAGRCEEFLVAAEKSSRRIVSGARILPWRGWRSRCAVSKQLTFFSRCNSSLTWSLTRDRSSTPGGRSRVKAIPASITTASGNVAPT